jgi:hypothetical protein
MLVQQPLVQQVLLQQVPPPLALLVSLVPLWHMLRFLLP